MTSLGNIVNMRLNSREKKKNDRFTFNKSKTQLFASFIFKQSKKKSRIQRNEFEL